MASLPEERKNDNVYSSNEIKTDDMWFEKRLYRKTFEFENLSGNQNIPHNIANIERAMVNPARSFAVPAVDSNRSLPLPYTSSDASSAIGVFVDKYNISFRFGSNISATSAIVTIEYTKTTD